mgnify:CR=1 FL=1
MSQLIIIQILYTSKQGTPETLTLSLSLKNTVTTASASESIADIKKHAPLTYYTQNRMITGEDYNLAPLSVSQTVSKVKTINRTSSGVSRNFDLIDVSGKYSSINVFCTDGVIYREKIENSCKHCGKDIQNVKMYCDNTCQVLSQREEFLKEWKEGKKSGAVGKQLLVSNHRKWLRAPCRIAHRN